MATSAQISWQVLDSGVLPGHENMTIDKWALEEMNEGLIQIPKIRFFQWENSTVSFGYLLDQNKVKEWALSNGQVDFVRRPTAGGAVFHQKSDLSLSLLWPRHKNILPENSRECYAKIHQAIKVGLEKLFPDRKFSLHKKENGDCSASIANMDETPVNFSICYETPVCNDVMAEGRKIVGGALRLSKKTILYQGNIILEGKEDLAKLKEGVRSELA